MYQEFNNGTPLVKYSTLSKQLSDVNLIHFCPGQKVSDYHTFTV